MRDAKNSNLVEHTVASENNIQWWSADIIVKEQKWKKHNIMEAACVDGNCVSQLSATIHPMFGPFIHGYR